MKILSLIATLCAIWVIYDVWSNNRRLSEASKILWTIFALIFSVIAALIYYLVHKRERYP